MDDYEAAIKDLDKSISYDAQYANAYYSRAFWKDISGDYAGAVSDYKKVIELDSTYREAYIGLATTLYQHGEKTPACELLKIAADKGSIMADELVTKLCN
jgi:tetratricopeptide (TPR) repeat protein